MDEDIAARTKWLAENVSGPRESEAVSHSDILRIIEEELSFLRESVECLCAASAPFIDNQTRKEPVSRTLEAKSPLGHRLLGVVDVIYLERHKIEALLSALDV